MNEHEAVAEFLETCKDTPRLYTVYLVEALEPYLKLLDRLGKLHKGKFSDLYLLTAISS